MTDEEATRDSPYQGLTPYREEDAPFFFGRDTERDHIISNLMGSRLTLLYGPTGVGKSSVLRAGVAYRLGILARKNFKKSGTPEFAVVVFNKWSGEPLRSLCDSIRKSVAQTMDDDTLKDAPPSANLTLALQTFSELINGELLIILDQFEEFFLYHGQNGEEAGFVREFARAVNRTNIRVSFLISIREDALAKLDIFKGKIPGLFGNYLRIEHLSTQAAEEAIRKPLAVYNTLPGVKFEFAVEDELVEAVCKQVQAGSFLTGETGYGALATKSGKPQVETSILQLVMTRLWKEELAGTSHTLRLITLNRLGHAGTIVKNHLNTELDSLTEGEQKITAKVFYYLVTPGGTKYAYTASDLAGYTGLPESTITPVLDKLSKARILRQFFATERSENKFEIFHDVLARPILDWRAQYRKKREEEKAKQLQEREQARQNEQARRRDLKAQQRLRRLGVWLMLSALVTVVTFGMYLYADGQRLKAINAQAEAENARRETERQKDETERQKAEAQKMLAVVQTLDRSVPYFKAVMRGHAAAVGNINLAPTKKKSLPGAAITRRGCGRPIRARSYPCWAGTPGRLIARPSAPTEGGSSLPAATVRCAFGMPPTRNLPRNLFANSEATQTK